MKKKCTQIYQGIDVTNNFLDTGQVKRKFSVKKDSVLLITIANDRNLKGLDRILSTAKILLNDAVDFTWITFGKGTERFSTDYSQANFRAKS